MNTVIEQMLRKYDSKNIYDQKNAMKEVMQEIVLYGLSRAGFFREAAFYGGTALRIFYGLDRFSEAVNCPLPKCDHRTSAMEVNCLFGKDLNDDDHLHHLS